MNPLAAGRRARLARVLAVIGLAGGARELHAQATLRVSTTEVELPAADATDYSIRATRAAAIQFEIAGCSRSTGCTLTIATSGAPGELEWQLDATSPDAWRPVTTLAQGGIVLSAVRGEGHGVIFLRARLDWERDEAPLFSVVRLSLATN
ncbi:MAG TPA: hypothetical protein VHM30_01655 [Gemmatimonadaceae bacterium]|nr:hypothetical protein [Gemmatimonadaceae bacterium]